MYRLLDLFCGAGGAARGYQAAGFHVTGVDIKPQPSYPSGARFIRDDAVRLLESDPAFCASFDVIHASPPCQAYSVAAVARRKDTHLDYVPYVRTLLEDTGRPFVIENVPGAPLRGYMLLCGSQFGLPIIRHRWFEAHGTVIRPPAQPCTGNGDSQATSATGHPGGPYYAYAKGNWEKDWKEIVIPELFSGMTLYEASQAIPPAYAFHVAQSFLVTLSHPAAAAA